ncbi:MAG: hypothetical protein JWO14_2215 [Solirubrobacterales bacterium]|nr:hypothetical protein [Solirubrobacterales bacterium]
MILFAILAGLVSGAISVFLPMLLGGSSGWRTTVSRWFGSVGLGYVRTASAAVFGITISTAIGLGVSDHTHRPVTYLVWYGLALMALAAIIATTVLIDRTEPPEVSADEPKPPPVRKPRNILGQASGRLIEDELVKLIDEWRKLRASEFGETSAPAYNVLERKTSDFLSAALGDAERQRFQSNRGVAASTRNALVDLRITALEALRDNPRRWHFRRDLSGLQAAVGARRSLDRGERIAIADSPLAEIYGSEQDDLDSTADVSEPDDGEKAPADAPESVRPADQEPSAARDAPSSKPRRRSRPASLASLEKLYTDGDRMLKATNPLSPISSFGYGPAPTEADVDAWKRRVLSALPQAYRNQFQIGPLQAEQTSPFGNLGTLGLPESETARRLRLHLAELQKIMGAMV